MAFNIVTDPTKADINEEISYIQEESIFFKHLLSYLAESETKQEFADVCVHWYKYQKSLNNHALYKAISLLFWPFAKFKTFIRQNKFDINSILKNGWWEDC